MMAEQDFNVLLKGYLGESLSPSELETFLSQAQRPENILLLQQSFEKDLAHEPADLASPGQSSTAWSKLQEKLDILPAVTPVRRFPWYWVAASVALLAILGGAYFSKRHTKPELANTRTEIPLPSWLKPEHIAATIYLMNGDSIELGLQQQGKIAAQDGMDLFQSAGTISYSGSGEAGKFNEIKTGAGKMFRCILPDQTMVWLNVSSSIRYPLQFSENQRTVEITGEAYFEVTHDAKKPFRVKAGKQILEDIGTSFDVNSSNTHEVTTTLIDGSVSVDFNSQKETLTPGEQSIASDEKNQLIVDVHANLEKALAWKNGLFYFQHAGLRTVMKELADWYQVSVVFKGADTSAVFSGQIDKSLPLSQVLQGLQQPGVEFIQDNDHQVTVVQK